MASEIFRRQMRAAYERQLHEHEQSAARFVETLASLCEHEQCDGLAIANALRGAGKKEPLQKSSGETPTKKEKSSSSQALALEPSPASTVRAAAREETGGSQQSSERPSAGKSVTKPKKAKNAEAKAADGGSHLCSGETLEDKPELSDDSGDSFEGIANDHKGHNLKDMTHNDHKYMKNEFKITQCTFITEQGKIIKPPNELMKKFGPKFEERLKRFTCKKEKKEGFENMNKVKKESCLVGFIESSLFKTTSVMAITLNYFFIIAQTDRKMSDLNSPEPLSFRVIDLTFTSYYTFEVGVTLIALRLDFFCGFDSSWNIFDLVIVFFSLFQEVLQVFQIDSIDTSFLRVLRFLRISKILRMFEAMRMCKEVKIMVDSLMGSFFIFLCCVLMLALYLSVFGIFFVQGMTTMLETETPEMPLEDKLSFHVKTSISRDFGTVLNSMVTLFMALTGGEDWAKFYSTIVQMGTTYSILFLFFYLFAIMSFFNVVTGVFCEKAMSLARPGASELMVRRQAKEIRDASELIKLMRKILKLPPDHAPALTATTFDDFLTNPEVITYFEMRGLNPSTAHRFFQVLSDVNQTNEIDFKTFVSACVKLDGPASSIDLHVLSVELKAVQMSLHNLHSHSLTRFEETIETIKANVPKSHPALTAAPLNGQASPQHGAAAHHSSHQPHHSSHGHHQGGTHQDDVYLSIPPMPVMDHMVMGLGGDLEPLSAELTGLSMPSRVPSDVHGFDWAAPTTQRSQTDVSLDGMSPRSVQPLLDPGEVFHESTTITYHAV